VHLGTTAKAAANAQSDLLTLVWRQPMGADALTTDWIPALRQAQGKPFVGMTGVSRTHQLRGNAWIIANTAPWGSARIAMRPTFSMVMGAKWVLAPSSLALAAVSSQFATKKYTSQ